MTAERAAEVLGVDRSTITRYTAAGTLVAYLPQCARRRQQRVLLYWAAEVEEVRAARDRISRQTTNVN